MENGNYGHKSNPNAAGEHCDKNELSVSSHNSTKTWDTSFGQLRDFWSNTERGGSSSYYGCKSLASVAPVPEVRHKNNTQSNNANVLNIRGNKKYYSEDGDLVTGRKVSSLRPQLQYDIAHPDEKSNNISQRKLYRHPPAEDEIHSKSVMRDVHPGNDVSRTMNANHEPTYANTRKHGDSIEYESSRNQRVGGRRNSTREPQNYFVNEENGPVYKDIALDGARIMNDRYSHETRSNTPHGRIPAIGSRRESSLENKTKGSIGGYPPPITGSQRNRRLRTTYDGSNQRQSRIFQHTENSTRNGIQGDEFNSRTPAYATSFSHETQMSSENARDLQQLNAPMENEGKASRQERSILYEGGSRIPPEALHNVSDFYDDVEDERGRITQEPDSLSEFHRESFRADGSNNWCPVREDELIYEEVIDPRSTVRSKQRDGSILKSYTPQGREVGVRKRTTFHERTLDETFERGSQKVNREPISTDEQIYHDSEFQNSFPQNSAINGRRSTSVRHESHKGLRPSKSSNNNESGERRRTLINNPISSSGEAIFEDRFDDPAIDYNLERRQTRPETFRMVSFSGEDRVRRETQRPVELESETLEVTERRRRSSTVKPRSRQQSLRYSHATIHAPEESESLRASRRETEQLDEYITQQRRTTLDERRVTADLQREPAVTHLIEAEKYNEFRDVSTEMVDGVKRGTYDEQRSIPGSQKSSAEQEDGACNPKCSKLVSKQGAPKLGSKRDDSAQKSLSIERESLGAEEARNNMRISDNAYYTQRPVYRDEEVDHVGDTNRDSRDSVITSRAIDRGSMHDRSLSEVSEPVYEDIVPMNKVEVTKHTLNPSCQCACRDLVQRAHSQRTERSTHSDVPVVRSSKSRSKPEEITGEERRTIYGERNSILQSQKRISHTDDYNYGYAYDDDEGDDYDNDNDDEEEDAFEEGSRKTAISERQSEYMPSREILRSSRSSISQELLDSKGANRVGPSIYEEMNDPEGYTGSSQRASEYYKRYSSRGSELKDQRRYTSDGRKSDLKFQRERQMKHYDTADRVRQTIDDSQSLIEIRRISPYQDATANDRKSRHLDSDSKERQHLRTDDEADLRRHNRRITEHSYPESDYISRRESHKVYDKPLVFRKTIGDPESITEAHGISAQPVEGIGKRSTFVGEGGRLYTSQATEFESPTSTVRERKSERTTGRESQKIYIEPDTFRRQTVDNSRSLTEVHRLSRRQPGNIGDKLTHIGSDGRRYTCHDKEIENVSPSIIHERIPDRVTEKESQEIYDEPGIFKRQITDNVQSVNEVHTFSKMKTGSMDKKDKALAQPDAREFSSQGSAIEHPRSTLRERSLDRRTEKESQKIYDETRTFKRQTVDDSESLNEDQRIARQEAGSMNKRRSALTRSGVRNAPYSGQLENPVSTIPERISNQRGESHDVYVEPETFKRHNNDDSKHPNEVRRISRQQAESMEEGRLVPDGPDVRRYANRPSEIENSRRSIVRGRTSDRRTERETQKIYEEPESYLRDNR